MKTVLTTQRLSLRDPVAEERAYLDEIFQDPETIHTYGYLFSPEELNEWYSKQLDHHIRRGFGLWSTVERVSNTWIGLCGVIRRNIESVEELEVCYFLRPKFRHRGYAREAAAACRDYAFNTLGARRVVSCVRVDNAPSRHVAEFLGMSVDRIFVRHCSGTDIPYALYALELPEKRRV